MGGGTGTGGRMEHLINSEGNTAGNAEQSDPRPELHKQIAKLNAEVSYKWRAIYEYEEKLKVCAAEGCDLKDWDDDAPLTDVRVITADGEEGYDDEKRWLCQEHLIEFVELTLPFGFGNHKHGGIHFLEDTRCKLPWDHERNT